MVRPKAGLLATFLYLVILVAPQTGVANPTEYVENVIQNPTMPPPDNCIGPPSERTIDYIEEVLDLKGDLWETIRDSYQVRPLICAGANAKIELVGCSTDAEGEYCSYNMYGKGYGTGWWAGTCNSQMFSPSIQTTECAWDAFGSDSVTKNHDHTCRPNAEEKCDVEIEITARDVAGNEIKAYDYDVTSPWCDIPSNICPGE